MPRRILLAPDSFKGTLSSGEVAEAVGRGLGAAGRAVELCPVADGGEGTLAALAEPLGLEPVEVMAADPLGRPIAAEFGLGNRIALVESARASGLGLVGPAERDAWAASSYGTGELIAASVQAGAETIYVGVGGSATTDGGAGALDAIERSGGLDGARLVVLCDVRTPFEDAARVFGPQKGASRDDVQRLTRRLTRIAGRLARDPRGIPMTGAAGGLSGALWGQLGAQLVPGATFVLDELEFDRRMRASRAVVTGEGRLDRQSLAGKLLSEVATRARQAGVPCHAVVGENQLDAFGLRVLDLQAVFEAGTRRQLIAAGKRLASRI